MATAVRERFGTRACRECGKEVLVFINAQGTLGYSCQWCGDRGYVRKAEADRYADWTGKIKRLTSPAPEPAPAPPAPAPAPEPKPAPKPSRTVLG